LDVVLLQGGAQRRYVFQTKEVVHVDGRRRLDALIGQQVGKRVHHFVRLLQQREEVRQLHVDELARQGGGRKKWIAVSVGDGRDGEVHARAPGRQHQVELVGAHHLLIG